MGGFTPPLAGDPRVRSVRVVTLSRTLADVSATRIREGVKELADSIQQHGLLVPPVVMVRDKQVVLLAGARRVAAASSLGWQTMEAFWIGSAQEMAEWFAADAMAHDVHPSTAPLPMTWAQIGTMYDRLIFLLPRGNFTSAMVANTGVHRGDLQGSAFLVRTMQRHGDARVRKFAREVLAEADSGLRKPHSGVRLVREFEVAPGGPVAKITAQEQAKIIGNLPGQVAGLVAALELLIPMHPDLPKEAREAGGKALSELGRAVTRVGRILRSNEENPK